MTPEELAIKHFPYNTSCPMKRKKIDWQRENLTKEIKQFFVPMSTSLLQGTTEIVYHYARKKEAL